MLLDFGNHENGPDDGDSTECSDKSPPSYENVSKLMIRSIAIPQEARKGPRQLGKAIVWDKAVKPSVNVNVPAFEAHLA